MLPLIKDRSSTSDVLLSDQFSFVRSQYAQGERNMTRRPLHFEGQFLKKLV